MATTAKTTAAAARAVATAAKAAAATAAKAAATAAKAAATAAKAAATAAKAAATAAKAAATAAKAAATTAAKAQQKTTSAKKVENKKDNFKAYNNDGGSTTKQQCHQQQQQRQQQNNKSPGCRVQSTSTRVCTWYQYQVTRYPTQQILPPVILHENDLLTAATGIIGPTWYTVGLVPHYDAAPEKLLEPAVGQVGPYIGVASELQCRARKMGVGPTYIDVVGTRYVSYTTRHVCTR